MALTPELIEERIGHPTSSGAHRLMANHELERPLALPPACMPLLRHIVAIGKRPTKVGDIPDWCDIPKGKGGVYLDTTYAEFKYYRIPPGLVTYAEELACAELFPDEQGYTGENNPDILRGEGLELDCVDAIQEVTGYQFDNTGSDQKHILHPEGAFLGCTPDGVRFQYSIADTGCEAKARAGKAHLKQRHIKDNVTCKALDFHRFCQVNACMACTDTDRWQIGSLNPGATLEALRFYHAVIYRDDKFIAELERRAKLAMQIKDNFLGAVARDLAEG